MGEKEASVGSREWLSLGALSLVYITNQWSRSALYYMVSFSASAKAGEFMNADLGFGQTQYSILASFGFTALFALTSLFAGRIADRSDRAKLTAGSCAVWGLATIATGFAPSFLAVLILRVIQGISQGFTTPSAYGLLSETFPASQRATANSLYSSGVYVGGGLASLSVLLVSTFGWRQACFAVGGVSLVAAAVAAVTITDPSVEQRRKPTDGGPGQEIAKTEPSEQDSLAATVKEILSNPTVLVLFLACALRFCAGFGIGVWAAPFFRQTFPDNQAEYGVVNAIVVGVFGFLSSFGGGKLADTLTSRSSDKGVKAWLMAGSCFLAIPSWCLVASSQSFSLAMAFLALEYLVAECWFGPAIAILQESVPPNKRGTAQGMFSVLTTIGNIAPVAIGAAVSQGTPLRTTLLLSIPVFYGLAGLAFLGTGASLRATAGQKPPAKSE